MDEDPNRIARLDMEQRGVGELQRLDLDGHPRLAGGNAQKDLDGCPAARIGDNLDLGGDSTQLRGEGQRAPGQAYRRAEPDRDTFGGTSALLVDLHHERLLEEDAAGIGLVRPRDDAELA